MTHIQTKATAAILGMVFAIGSAIIASPDAHAAPSAINCVGKMNNPHHSHHVPGMVNAQATVKCDAPIENISITVTLTRDDGKKVVSKPSSKAATAKHAQNAAMACDGNTHSYTARADFVWKGPTSWNPPVIKGSDSATAKVTC